MNERYTLGPIAISISVMALFVAVADLGTAVVLVATTVAVIFVAGVDFRYLAVCAVLGLLLGLGFIAMKPYRLARFIDFVDKDHKILTKIDPKGASSTTRIKPHPLATPVINSFSRKLPLARAG